MCLDAATATTVALAMQPIRNGEIRILLIVSERKSLGCCVLKQCKEWMRMNQVLFDGKKSRMGIVPLNPRQCQSKLLALKESAKNHRIL